MEKPVPDVIEHTDILNQSASKHGQSQLVQELMDITGAWKRYSYECLSKITPAKLFTKQFSLPDTRSRELSSQLPSAGRLRKKIDSGLFAPHKMNDVHIPK